MRRHSDQSIFFLLLSIRVFFFSCGETFKADSAEENEKDKKETIARKREMERSKVYSYWKTFDNIKQIMNKKEKKRSEEDWNV